MSLIITLFLGMLLGAFVAANSPEVSNLLQINKDKDQA